MPTQIDDIMQTASQALTDRDYPECVSLCLQALTQARSTGNWADYARIILPLQESRRLIRQAALEGRIRLGTADVEGGSAGLLDGLHAGCLVVTSPLTAEEAHTIVVAADASRQPIEVLYAEASEDGASWVLRGLPGSDYCATRPAPPSDWQHRWVPGGPGAALTPAHWWMEASEALGNAALDAVAHPPGTTERIDALEAALASVGDHELLHQALADAARAAAQPGEAR